MIQQVSDSLALAQEQPEKHQKANPRHPYQVLRMLPHDATPEQQDSAIQAMLPVQDVHYSLNPDTLHLPGAKPGKNLKEVNIPVYYKENFFSKDSMYHPEIKDSSHGVAGDPVPYTVSNDNVVTGLLIGCFILALVAFAHSRQFFLNQAKHFFYRRESTEIYETAREVRFQLFFVFQTCLLMSILYFLYNGNYQYDTISLSSPYQLFAIYVGVFAAYFILKEFAYNFVNWIFFDKKKNGQWMRASFFITALEGVTIYPIVLLRVYFNLSVENTIIYFLIAIILYKMLLFYKCYSIFFRRFSGFLQIIVYFCAFEVIPLFAIWGTLVLIDSYFKINY